MIPCEALVAFKDIPIMEGVEMQERLLSMEKFVESGKPVVTSARRFINSGIIRQKILNIAVVTLFSLSVSPSAHKRSYGVIH